MLEMDRVCIYRSGDRDRIEALAEEFRRAGITCSFLPSYEALAAWDIEVSADDLDAARALLESSAAP